MRASYVSCIVDAILAITASSYNVKHVTSTAVKHLLANNAYIPSFHVNALLSPLYASNDERKMSFSDNNNDANLTDSNILSKQP